MRCRACGREERASEGYPCVDCGTFICLICTFRGVTLCAASCAAKAAGSAHRPDRAVAIARGRRAALRGAERSRRAGLAARARRNRRGARAPGRVAPRARSIATATRAGSTGATSAESTDARPRPVARAAPGVERRGATVDVGGDHASGSRSGPGSPLERRRRSASRRPRGAGASGRGAGGSRTWCAEARARPPERWALARLRRRALPVGRA